MPRTRDLAIFMPTTTDRQTDCFTPCACTQGKYILHAYSSLLPSQHVDVAALLIKYDSPINATDRWNFTPLHEAAQKGRTQLCSLLILHGANVNMKNQEGQIPYDLATVSVRVCMQHSVWMCACACVDNHYHNYLATVPLL